MFSTSDSVRTAVFVLVATLAVGLFRQYRKFRSFGQKLLRKLQKNAEVLGTVQLLNDEKTRQFTNPAVSTLTFYQGKYDGNYLTQRITELIQANPYLAGRLVHVDNTSAQLKTTGPTCAYPLKPSAEECAKHIEVVTDHRIAPDAPYEQLFSDTQPYSVLNGKKCIDRDEPLFKITVFTSEKKKRFVVMVSLSHVIADGYTYYKIYSMLNPSTPVVALDFVRQPRFETEVNTGMAFGNTPASYVLGLCGAMMNWYVRSPTMPVIRYVNNDHVAAEKRKFVEQQQQKQLGNTAAAKEEKGSGNKANAGTSSFLSTNDIITSWFFRVTHCALGMFVANYRPRKSYLGPDVAGNYLGRVLFTGPEMYNPAAIREAVLALDHHTGNEVAPTLAQVLELNLSFVTNWAAFFTEVQLPGSKLLSHLPVFSVRVRPMRNCLVVFQASKNKTGLLLWIRKDVVGRLNDEGLLLEQD